jgi:release factor glutamine methyltransferase
MKIREAVALGRTGLKNSGIEQPVLDSTLLLAHILNISRTELTSMGTEPLSKKNLAAFNELINRRINGECIAYITGKKEFYGLDFIVNSSVLVPRPDTEILVETALNQLSRILTIEKNQNIRVLELCTGSGAVAISLKHEMPEIEIDITDISAEALEIAKINAARLIPNNQNNFYQGDLYDALPSSLSTTETAYSLIISNPPYIPTGIIQTLPIEVQKEPFIALDGGHSGLEIINRIINGAPKYLIKGGILLMEADPHQMEDIKILLEKNGFNEIIIHKDLSGFDRVIGGVYY